MRYLFGRASGAHALRVGLLVTLASMMLIPLTTQSAWALGHSANVSPTHIVGGIGNPCGATQEDPGVLLDGHAEAAFKANNSVKLTYTMRTRYDAGVATAFDTGRSLGQSTSTLCGAGWNAVGKAPADVLYSTYCSVRSSLWCNAINQIPASARSKGVAAYAPDVADCSGGPLRWLGWSNLGAKIAEHKLLFGNGPVIMHNINMGAGLTGYIDSSGGVHGDNAEGKTLQIQAADAWAYWWIYYGAVYNSTYGTRPGWPQLDLSRIDLFVPQLNIMWGAGMGSWPQFTLNGLNYAQALSKLNSVQCSSGPWMADTLDPAYNVSSIGLDQDFRFLSSLLDGDPVNYDKPCRDDTSSCKPFNFYRFYSGIWDATGFTAPCNANHNEEVVKDTLRKSGPCKIG